MKWLGWLPGVIALGLFLTPWVAYTVVLYSKDTACEAQVSMSKTDLEFLEMRVDMMEAWTKDCEVKASYTWTTGDSLTALMTCPAFTPLPIE